MHPSRLWLLVILSIASVRPAVAQTQGSIVGNWQGALNVGGVSLRLALSISEADGNLTGKMRSLDQGGAEFPLSAVNVEKDQVKLEAAAIGASFDGKLDKSADAIAGNWTQGGGKLPLTFKRTEQPATLNRPQVPKPPLPYREEQVSIRTGAAGVTLAGTLTLPPGTGPHPAVVLLTGSGPQDRDEALMGHRPFLVLADHLARQGIAVLRCDDRGVARSTGDFSKATHTDFVEDALASLAWLKTRKEIDPRRRGFAGHSEGGLVAPLAAIKAPDDVAFIVLLAGVGLPMDELLIQQGKDLARVAGATEATITKNASSQRELFQSLKQATSSAAAEKIVRDSAARQLADYTPEQQKAMGLSQTLIDSQSKMAASPWFWQLLAYDPQPTLRQVTCPVLAINGEKDVQVAAKDNIAAIEGALAAGGNQHGKTAILPGLNHLFQTCTTGSISEYGQIEETMSPAALSLVSDWIKELSSR